MKKSSICYFMSLFFCIVTVVLFAIWSFFPLKYEPGEVWISSPNPNPNPNSNLSQSSTDADGIEKVSTVFSSQNSNQSLLKGWRYTLNVLMPKLEDCGHREKNPMFQQKRRRKRIVGGEEIENQNMYPWVGQVGFKSDESDPPLYTCGCSLISSRYVLTAAHCVHRPKTSHFVVKLRAETELVKVEEIEIHPKYSKENPDGRIHDIALIRLSKSVHLSNTVCLPFTKHYGLDENVFEVDSGYVTGYASNGSLSTTENEMEASPTTTLRQVKLSLVSNGECEEVYEKQKDLKRIITTAQFCAGNEVGKDFCKGDSGNGFFLQNTDGKYFQRGIASFGTKLCGSGRPGVFVDLLFTPNRHWILQTIRD